VCLDLLQLQLINKARHISQYSLILLVSLPL
jgi:hypothetical protein